MTFAYTLHIPMNGRSYICSEFCLHNYSLLYVYPSFLSSVRRRGCCQAASSVALEEENSVPSL